jgi:hypothetical protein
MVRRVFAEDGSDGSGMLAKARRALPVGVPP